MDNQFKKINIPLNVGNLGTIPKYATSGSVGCDLFYCGSKPMVIPNHRVVRIPTGISLSIPKGYEGQIRPRSGMTTKHGIIVVNGTIDCDYRGKIDVMAYAIGREYNLQPHTRIAQIVFCPVVKANFIICPDEDKFSPSSTNRGWGGFGST